MGYHVELVASPPRPILWDELAQAGQALSDGAAWLSCRSPTDGCTHPDDKAAHAQAALPSPEVEQMRKRERARGLFRLRLLPIITAGSGDKVRADFQ